jgi:hypothetical protein
LVEESASGNEKERPPQSPTRRNLLLVQDLVGLLGLHILPGAKSTQRTLAKDVGIGLARLGEFDDQLSEGPVGVITPVGNGSEPLHVERKYGDIGRDKAQAFAMTQALAALIRFPEGH